MAETGKITFVEARDGLSLGVRHAGPEDRPPLLLVHGFSQGSLCWNKQLSGALSARFHLIAPDLRGHGMSQPVGDLQCLGEGATWADDLHFIVETLCRGRKPILIGWSYGGRILCEYLRAYSEGAARAAVFVNAVTQSDLAGQFAEGHHLLGEMMQPDDARSIPATIAFLELCGIGQLATAERDLMIGVNIRVSAAVRSAMSKLVSNNTAFLQSLNLPVLVIHGAQDKLLRATASEHIARCVPAADYRVMSGAGHAPFLDDADLFDELIDDFVSKIVA